MREYIDRNELRYDDIECTDGHTYMVVHAPEIDNAKVVTEKEIVKSYFELLKQVMKERNEDNGGEPLNAIDKGYDLAFQHMCLEMNKILLEQEKQNKKSCRNCKNTASNLGTNFDITFCYDCAKGIKDNFEPKN